MCSIMQGVKCMQTLQANINALLVVLNAFPDYKMEMTNISKRWLFKCFHMLMKGKLKIFQFSSF